MSKIEMTSSSRVIHDPNNRAIRSWFDPTGTETAKAPFTASDLAQHTLQENAFLFGWDPAIPDLKRRAVLPAENAVSVRYNQEHRGIPVDSSEVVVNLFPDGRVYSIYNQYHYDIPAKLVPDDLISEQQAREQVQRHLKSFREHQIRDGELIIYQYHNSDHRPPKGVPGSRASDALLAEFNSNREALSTAKSNGEANMIAGPQEGEYFVAWDFKVITFGPTTNLRFLVDATSGNLITIIDLAHYASGTSSVFNPNPLVTSGNTGLSWTSNAATLNGERVPVTVERLNPADGMGNLRLDGSFVQMVEFENPVVAEPTSGAGNFTFNYDANGFLNAMAYYHIDTVQNYFQTVLNMNNAANFSIEVDAQGLQGSGDNSHFLPLNDRIAFGRRNVDANNNDSGDPDYNPVPDAADAMVILHEYGHAIQDNMAPGFSGFSGGVGEGFGDFLAAVYFDDKHKTPANTRGIMMSFDANTTDAGWGGRRYDKATKFNEAAFTNAGGYGRAEVWASAMFELYRKLGGDSQYPWVKSAARDLAIRLHLMATKLVPVANSTVTDWGQQILAMDSALGGWRYANGLHKKVIYDTFRLRRMSTFPDLASDVYIDDGRSGGYGSMSGNDLFTETLFVDNYWSCEELWVRTAPYANNAAQQAGGPGDHVEPPVGSLAYLYVRVKNKGTQGSGSVTVKGFHSDPTIGLVWPTDWTPTDTPSHTVANIPAGSSNVFGPFPWTPVHVGHECVFAIVECPNDRAITQDLAVSDLVSHADLVPFDNNIGQRNLYPTEAKNKMSHGFWVSNPTFEKGIVKLHFDSTFPEGWNFRVNVANPEAIHLGPRERRWMEVTIDQGNGPEITDFTKPPRLDIAGSLDGKLIGGVSFYAGPDSAFPGRSGGSVGGVETTGSVALCRTLGWLILIVSLALLVLGIVILAGGGTPALVMLLAVLGLIAGVLVLFSALRGCCGFSLK